MPLSVSGNTLEIKDLVISDQEICTLLLDASEEQREELIRKALKIGLLALKGSATTEKVDYIEKEFSKFRISVDEVLKEAHGNIKTNLSEIFSEDGALKLALDRYLGEGGRLTDLFDENKKDSAIGKISAIMNKHFEGDGSIIKTLLDSNNPSSPLYLFKKDLIDRLEDIESSLKTKAALADLEEKTALKGIEFEALVLREVDKIAKILEDNVAQVGSQEGYEMKSKTGDILSIINQRNTNGRNIKIVFEVKDSPVGLGRILKELDEAKKNRRADAAIAVYSSEKFSPPECGVFRVYEKERIVCVLDKEDPDSTMLQAAYKIAVAQALLKKVGEDQVQDTIDVERISRNINMIRDRVKAFTKMKSNLTSVNNYITKVQDELESFKSDLVFYTADMELAMNTASSPAINKPFGQADSASV